MKHFLILEDEALVREYLGMELKIIFPESKITSYSNVDDLITNLDVNAKIDLFLLDLNLGTKNSGIEVAKYIRMNFNTKIIFITANYSNEILEQLSLIDPDSYITKPFCQIQFQATIKTVLQNRSVQPERILSGHLLSLEELFQTLKKTMDKIQKAAPHRSFKESIDYLNVAENNFIKFKINRSKEYLNDLIEKIWISSLRLEKTEIVELNELIKEYSTSAKLTIHHIKLLAKKMDL